MSTKVCTIRVASTHLATSETTHKYVQCNTGAPGSENNGIHSAYLCVVSMSTNTVKEQKDG